MCMHAQMANAHNRSQSIGALTDAEALMLAWPGGTRHWHPVLEFELLLKMLEVQRLQETDKHGAMNLNEQ